MSLCKDEQQQKTENNDSVLWQAAAAGDTDAREKLIIANRPMVYWLAKKFKVSYSVYEGIVQEGMAALMNAVDTYDVNKNMRFSAFAYYKIRSRMIAYIERDTAKREAFAREVAAYGTPHSNISPIEAHSEWSLDLENALSQLSENESAIIKALVMQGKIARDNSLDGIAGKAAAALRLWLSGLTAKIRAAVNG